MIVKLIQVPAYIIIFILAVLFLITIFTAPFTAALFIFDYLMLIMTGLLNSAAVIAAIRQRKTTFKSSFWVLLLQFFFCADAVASVVFFLKVRQLQFCETGDGETGKAS